MKVSTRDIKTHATFFPLTLLVYNPALSAQFSSFLSNVLHHEENWDVACSQFIASHDFQRHRAKFQALLTTIYAYLYTDCHAPGQYGVALDCQGKIHKNYDRHLQQMIGSKVSEKEWAAFDAQWQRAISGIAQSELLKLKNRMAQLLVHAGASDWCEEIDEHLCAAVRQIQFREMSIALMKRKLSDMQTQYSALLNLVDNATSGEAVLHFLAYMLERFSPELVLRFVQYVKAGQLGALKKKSHYRKRINALNAYLTMSGMSLSAFSQQISSCDVDSTLLVQLKAQGEASVLKMYQDFNARRELVLLLQAQSKKPASVPNSPFDYLSVFLARKDNKGDTFNEQHDKCQALKNDPYPNLSPLTKFFLSIIYFEQNQQLLGRSAQDVDDWFDFWAPYIDRFIQSLPTTTQKESAKQFFISLLIRVNAEINLDTQGHVTQAAFATMGTCYVDLFFKAHGKVDRQRKSKEVAQYREQYGNIGMHQLNRVYRFAMIALNQLNVDVDDVLNEAKITDAVKTPIYKNVNDQAIDLKHHYIERYAPKPLSLPRQSTLASLYQKWQTLHWGWKVLAGVGVVGGVSLIAIGAICMPPSLTVTVPLVIAPLKLKLVVILLGELLAMSATVGHFVHTTKQARDPVKKKRKKQKQNEEQMTLDQIVALRLEKASSGKLAASGVSTDEKQRVASPMDKVIQEMKNAPSFWGRQNQTYSGRQSKKVAVQDVFLRNSQ